MEDLLAKKPEMTSAAVASKAAKILASPKNTASKKSVAASAPTQARDKPKR
jgi:hypothetical protein